MPPTVHRLPSLLSLALLAPALAAVEVNVVAAASSVTEGGSVALIATRDSTSGTLSVPVTLIGSPAYAHLPADASDRFEFANGSSVATLILSTDGDLVANGGGRQVSAQITVGGVVTSATPAVTIGVRDDDVTIALQAVDVLATEDALPADTGQVRIAVSGASRSGDLTVQFEVHGSATFATNAYPDDYQLSYRVASTDFAVSPIPGTELVNVVIPDTINEAMITLTPRSDTDPEGGETCELRLSTTSLAYTVQGSDHLPITIADDDNRITGLTGSPAYESGEDGNVHIAFLSDFPAGRTVYVPYLISNVANDGSEFAVLSGVATLASGYTLDLPIDAVWDQALEGDELVFTLLPSADYVLPGTPSITIPIVDCAGTASIATPASVIESSGVPLDFVVSVARYTGFGSADILVPFRIGGGTAAASEYTVAGAGVTWDSGSATGVIELAGTATTGTITVTPIDDATADGDKTVILTLEVGESVVVDVGHTSATGTILDDEPTVSLVRTGSDTASEGGAAVDFTISYPGVPVGTPRSQPVAVRFSVDGTAAVADRTVSGSGVVMDAGGATGTATIPAGATSVVVSVAAVSDATPEVIETVGLHLSTPPAGYRLGSATEATVNLVDPDGRPTVSIAGVASAIEGRTVQCFSVTRTGATTAALVVKLGTPAGTATAGDYQTLPTSVQIAAGAVSALVPVTAISDGLDSENLSLPLATDDAYLIGTGSAVVDIVSGFADNQLRITSEPADRVLAINDSWSTTCRLNLPTGLVAGRTRAQLGPVPSGSAVPGWVSVQRTSGDGVTDTAVFVVTASPPVGTLAGLVPVRVRLFTDVDADGTYELEVDQDLLLWVQSAGGDG